MENENKDTKNIVLGIMIGTVASVGAYYLIQSMRHRPEPLLHKVGRTISDLGEALQHTEIESFSDIKDEVQEMLPSGKDIMSSLFHWLSNGKKLLNKIKNGG